MLGRSLQLERAVRFTKLIGLIFWAAYVLETDLLKNHYTVLNRREGNNDPTQCRCSSAMPVFPLSCSRTHHPKSKTFESFQPL